VDSPPAVPGQAGIEHVVLFRTWHHIETGQVDIRQLVGKIEDIFGVSGIEPIHHAPTVRFGTSDPDTFQIHVFGIPGIAKIH
jgi:hypothetical protein